MNRRELITIKLFFIVCIPGGGTGNLQNSTWKGRALSLEGREPLAPREDRILRADVALLLTEALLRAESRTEALRLRDEARGVSQPASKS